MWIYIVLFCVVAVIGFIFGKKKHLQQLGQLLIQTGTPAEKASQYIYILSKYKSEQRKAKKATLEAYRKLLTQQSLEQIRRDSQPIPVETTVPVEQQGDK